ncbi:guanine nucleotide exchange factor [Melanogaster broomeanus]|nr:guanine nucleotide exchange factor [Melanogaster broomeanus]
MTIPNPLLEQYTALSTSSSTEEVSSALKAILTDAFLALSTVKSLGGTPEVAGVLGTASNLRLLLNLSTKVERSQQNDALRCIANTVLLNDSARVTFVGNEVDGGNACIGLLQKSSSTEHIFLASRILFLCTATASSAASFIEWLVEFKRPDTPGSGTAVDILAAKMDDLTDAMREGNRAAKEAMTDLLKLTFNLCVHYPKLVDCEVQSPEVISADAEHTVMGDYWSSRLDGLFPPLLRAFHASPLSCGNPLETPLTHTIHSLITIPVSPVTRNLWFGARPLAASSHPPSPDSASSSSGSPSHETQSPTFKEAKTKLLERASSVLSAGRRSLSWTSGSRSVTPIVPDSALRAYELLDATLAHFMPGDINSDDISIRNRVSEGETVDDLVSPLVILVTRFCLGDEDAKIRIKNWFIPPNLDRTSPLELRSDLLGRCLRLLQSVYHRRLNRVCGEMFFAMCDSDATTLSGYLGYGNVAGFLFHKGVVSAPARASTSGAPTATPTGLPINPITGTIEKEHEPVDMTDEEKEREAEKLFVLFDRLEKTGALPPSQNPIRKAMQQGKLG